MESTENLPYTVIAISEESRMIHTHRVYAKNGLNAFRVVAQAHITSGAAEHFELTYIAALPGHDREGDASFVLPDDSLVGTQTVLEQPEVYDNDQKAVNCLATPLQIEIARLLYGGDKGNDLETMIDADARISTGVGETGRGMWIQAWIYLSEWNMPPRDFPGKESFYLSESSGFPTAAGEERLSLVKNGFTPHVLEDGPEGCTQYWVEIAGKQYIQANLEFWYGNSPCYNFKSLKAAQDHAEMVIQAIQSKVNANEDERITYLPPDNLDRVTVAVALPLAAPFSVDQYRTRFEQIFGKFAKD